MGTRLKPCRDSSLTWTRCFCLLGELKTLSKVNAGQFLLLISEYCAILTGRIEKSSGIFQSATAWESWIGRSNWVTKESMSSLRVWEVYLCFHWFQSILKNKVLAQLSGTAVRLKWACKHAECLLRDLPAKLVTQQIIGLVEKIEIKGYDRILFTWIKMEFLTTS